MRRPLLHIVSTFAVGIFLAYYLSPAIWLVSYFILLILAGIKKERMLALLVITAFFGSLHMDINSKKLADDINLHNKIVTISGLVVGVEENKNTTLTVKIKDGSRYLVSFKPMESKEYIGDIISLKGKFTLPSKSRNPGLFDYNLYLKSRKIVGKISAFETNIEKENKENLIISTPYKIKRKVLEKQKKHLSQDGYSLILGILFGDKSAMNEDIYDAFQKNGTAHILSVSGIHVAIIYAYISRFFKNKRSKIANLAIILFLVFYCALAEFSPSVVRAVSMIVIHILGNQIHRRYDLACAVAFSALIMFIYNPYNLFNVGFQLSYIAVLSLAFILPVFDYVQNPILKAAIPLVSIQIAMAPLVAYHFMYFSFTAFLLNIPIIFLAGLVVPAGLILAIASLLPSLAILQVLVASSFMLLDKLLNLMIWINVKGSESGLSHMNVRAPSLLALLTFYGLVLFLASESFLILMQKRSFLAAKKIGVSLVGAALLASLITGGFQGKPDLVFLDVGQGDCLHIRTSGGKNILIDGGGQREYNVGEKILKPYFLKNGVKKIDIAFVTHLHHDHYDGLVGLSKELPILKLATYESNLLKIEELKRDLSMEDEGFLFLGGGDRLRIDKGVDIEVVYPEKRTLKEYEKLLEDEEDENLNSLVFLVNYNYLKILMTGDLGFIGEAILLKNEANIKADILKIGHHGSRFSTDQAFLDKVNPLISVIQVGYNNYGHPHPEVIEKLEKKSIIIYRNDLQGAVLIRVKKDGFKVRTML